MKPIYVFLIIFGSVVGSCVLFNPVVKCYYYCFPYKREQTVEI